LVFLAATTKQNFGESLTLTSSSYTSQLYAKIPFKLLIGQTMSRVNNNSVDMEAGIKLAFYATKMKNTFSTADNPNAEQEQAKRKETSIKDRARAKAKAKMAKKSKRKNK